MMLSSEMILSPSVPAGVSLPSKITPDLLASMVKLPCFNSGSPVRSLILVGLFEGKTPGSKVIVSSLPAFYNAQRSVPRLLSALLVTVKILPLAKGIA